MQLSQLLFGLINEELRSTMPIAEIENRDYINKQHQVITADLVHSLHAASPHFLVVIYCMHDKWQLKQHKLKHHVNKRYSYQVKHFRSRCFISLQRRQTNYLPTNQVAQGVGADLLASSVQIAYHCLDWLIVVNQVHFNDTAAVVRKASPRKDR